jgi:hypothetical protein
MTLQYCIRFCMPILFYYVYTHREAFPYTKGMNRVPIVCDTWRYNTGTQVKTTTKRSFIDTTGHWSTEGVRKQQAYMGPL